MFVAKVKESSPRSDSQTEAFESGYIEKGKLRPRLVRSLLRAISLTIPVAAYAVHHDASFQAELIAQATEQRRIDERMQDQRDRLQRPNDVFGPSQAKSTHRLPSSESPCFPITSIEIRGDSSEQFVWLLDFLAGSDRQDTPLQRCVGAEGVQLVVRRAQDALIERGFITSRVLTEPQDISGGRLVLSLVVGRISSIRFASHDGGRTPSLAGLPLRAGDVLNLRDIEQALESLKRVPTAQADIRIEPGSSPNESDLVIVYRQSSPFRANLSVDDSGSRGTGIYQGALTLSYDNWWSANDLLYLTLHHDAGGGLAGARGTQGHSAHYSIPWAYWLLAFNGNSSRYFQTVAGATANYVYSGQSESGDVKLARLLYRDASRKFTFSLRAFYRASRNFIDDAEIQVQRRKVGGWEMGAQYREQFGQATLDASVLFKRGTGAFGSLPSPEEAFGEGTSRFKLTSAELHYNRAFKALGRSWRWGTQWRAQWNRSPLTPQDRFAIGSRYTVRGFDGESALSAERGYTLRNDLSSPLGDNGREIYVGLDHGRVAGPSSALLVGQSLTGAVVGLRGAYKNLTYDLFAGRPLRQPDSFQPRRTVSGFQLNYSF